jgi:uncharacterized protein YjbI with pentapeptide repeats
VKLFCDIVIVVFVVFATILVIFRNMKENIYNIKEKIKRIKRFQKKILDAIFGLGVIRIVITIYVVAVILLLIFKEQFFPPDKKYLSDIFMYVGTLAGGILVVFDLFHSNKRNELIAKLSLDRFHFTDGERLLYSENVRAQLSAIQSFTQIAIEASTRTEQQYFARKIKEIFIEFIREKTIIEDNNGNANVSQRQKKIVVQTIIDVLFRNENSWKVFYKCIPFDLAGCVLDGINFSNAHLEHVTFHNAHLKEAKFRATNLKTVWFTVAHLEGAKFENANLEWTTFESANLKEATFRAANLKRVQLGGTNLREAVFLKSNFERVEFDFANLERAKFISTDLGGASFDRAHLEGTTFRWVHLENVRFTGAHLEEKWFMAANLKGTRFRSVHLEEAKFENCSWNLSTNFNGTIFEYKTDTELTEIFGNPPITFYISVPPRR